MMIKNMRRVFYN